VSDYSDADYDRLKAKLFAADDENIRLRGALEALVSFLTEAVSGSKETDAKDVRLGPTTLGMNLRLESALTASAEENARLREALEEFAEYSGSSWVVKQARAALSPNEAKASP
jgi:hypothetical protein